MRPVWKLIGGAPTHTMREMAQEVGCSLDEANRFWLATGFPKANPDQVLFTQRDIEALRTWYEQIYTGNLSTQTVATLIRAQSHLNDRLVLWQLEALVAEFQEQYDLDDTSARLVALDKIDQFLDLLQNQVTYAWRRQLSALLLNTNHEVGLRGRENLDPKAYPLERSMGFVDMVAYTRRSSAMSAHDLAELVQTFDSVCRTVITSRGGRVVKTIGDAVLFVASDLLIAADIVCALLENLKDRKGMLPVRASLVQGGVVSRAGDIFGPPVNLAARLADVASPFSVFIDPDTAKKLVRRDREAEYGVEFALSTELQGFGKVEAWQLFRRKPRIVDVPVVPSFPL